MFGKDTSDSINKFIYSCSYWALNFFFMLTITITHYISLKIVFASIFLLLFVLWQNANDFPEKKSKRIKIGDKFRVFAVCHCGCCCCCCSGCQLMPSEQKKTRRKILIALFSIKTIFILYLWKICLGKNKETELVVVVELPINILIKLYSHFFLPIIIIIIITSHFFNKKTLQSHNNNNKKKLSKLNFTKNKSKTNVLNYKLLFF